ncbi:hypothetical protein LCGC14_0840060 [marine sediment metagenome]|uniref:Uncharacterized protein n=1 Tax=marine sediment metagenome TaxID=412755 RepID=A0A0F9SKT0_9ZZZZ
MLTITPRGEEVLKAVEAGLITRLPLQGKVILIVLSNQGPLEEKELEHEVEAFWQKTGIKFTPRTRPAMRVLFEAGLIDKVEEANNA